MSQACGGRAAAPPGLLRICRFRDVVSVLIYSGTVSGEEMSGTYSVAGKQAGDRSASRSP